ncbi:MAG: two-component system alkaline phosphatase synthesis response regulator PhoP [Gammaproteobacteria bacterium]|jgi:two-component system alkaline phosphatase synthesis response regulator PhoP
MGQSEEVMSSRARILVVDDEVHLADGIRENLLAEGYDAIVAHDGEQGLNAAIETPFDLIISDVMMPNLDGVQMCEQLRKANVQTPFMFLTVNGAPSDRIRGLEAGGDDYLSKPFHLEELLLRVAAILKRTMWNQRAADHVLSFDKNEVNFTTYRATAWDSSEQDLTHKEAMILLLLSERDGQVVSREEILESVWGREIFPSTRTIDNFIVRLRKRFERDPEMPQFIHTIRGVGYRFTSVANDNQ